MLLLDRSNEQQVCRHYDYLLYSFYRVLICLYIFHCSENKHPNIIVMAYEVMILIILLYFQNWQSRINLGKSANIERRKFWFERIIRNNEKRYGKYGRNASWIVKRYWKYGRKDGKDMKNKEENRENTEERQVE